MVAHAAGRLPASKFVSLWGIPDLRFIEITPQSIAIGAGTTFTDMRTHATIASDLPLLARAATWIGSIANQSRATLGGNLVNGSPAADSSPALLVYDAEVELISVRGRAAFRTATSTRVTKRTRWPPTSFSTLSMCRAGSVRIDSICAKSAPGAPWPFRKLPWVQLPCSQTASCGNCASRPPVLPPFPPGSIAPKTRCAANPSTQIRSEPHAPHCLAEVLPIDDIRSTAEYRRHVAANLLEEFLTELQKPEGIQ